MGFGFQDKSVLVAMADEKTLQLLSSVLSILRFRKIDVAGDAEAAFKLFKKGNHDMIITGMDMSPKGGEYLAEKIRTAGSGSPNVAAPIILNAHQSQSFNGEYLRQSGFTDLLLSPFSVDDIRARLVYVFEHYRTHKMPPPPQTEPEPLNVEAANEGEEESLVQTLLGHYMQHHEAVLQKLQFAQGATLKSIEEVQAVKKELEQHDNTSLHSFSRFESMWKEIIALFLKGGMGEDEIFKIEGLITDIPADIKKHYTKLTQQDKSFLTLVEALNHDAYRKARAVAVAVQAAPNPMTGLKPEDYTVKKTEAVETIEDADLTNPGEEFTIAPSS